jgi:hypothetical protein
MTRVGSNDEGADWGVAGVSPAGLILDGERGGAQINSPKNEVRAKFIFQREKCIELQLIEYFCI